ncbi:MAG TPA: hypothetical protein VGN59_13760 [Acidimicrobiia bacterium]
MWVQTEPIHALTYFAPESHEAFEAAGLRGFWRGYFAGRAAPLGPAPAGLVTATFFGFRPDFVARAVPAVWAQLSPAEAVRTRLAGIDAATRRVLGHEIPRDAALDAADEVRRAVEAAPVGDRPLYGANAALPWPTDAYPALWHAATLLREHRGDGHVGALVAAGVDPTEAHLLRIVDDGLPLDSIRPYRGWSDEDWSAATARLLDRGWIDDQGHATMAGSATRAGIERETDRLSADLTARIDDLDAVMAVLTAATAAVRKADAVPYPNPIGVPRA